jgi:DNA-binding CsgD family transcriptional regulator
MIGDNQLQASGKVHMSTTPCANPVTVTAIEHAPTERQDLLAPVPRLHRFVFEFASRHGLSARETDTLLLAAQGDANKEIAAHLGISYKTVTEYWQRVCRKTGCHSQPRVIAAVIHYLAEARPDAYQAITDGRPAT